ncbi:hypothetical protein CkaCkLH20_02649 [Colletotrichum karsti]|uniref:Uncharacterized protein n=1 Tax=Colletotrichum karsti TaxID=1095194 RepID=A0A9P6LNF5_9PEZI|nr:uncharacterized protein CkaCkLH20_02649 [Colletotrichum karsti]KAF9879838.1 hypothetical protein CkaCkLH20_02649 [Colletotrichum karsti]
MATANEVPPALRCDSPSPEVSPTPAIGACPELTRCVSTASSVSHGSATDGGNHRESLGSTGSSTSRQSSGNYSRRSDLSFVSSSRQSTCGGLERQSSRRRGFVRPQGTDFAASARHRESVLSLGSIAHLQYYFARTGLLDGKGGQLARKNKAKGGLDLSSVSSSGMSSPRIMGSDGEQSFPSLSPLLSGDQFAGAMVESPTEDHDYYSDFDEPDPNVLPPTTSTYIHREKPVPKPPTIEELKTDLTESLEKAGTALKKARDSKEENARAAAEAAKSTPKKGSMGWFEVQGMHILDVMTLAIRAAKNYYTAHEVPERLDVIKSEKEIRTELFNVMETLKQMATRKWAGGMKDEEYATLNSWIQGLFSMLKTEEKMVEAEKAERSRWTWMKGDWTGKEVERELAFMASLDPQAEWEEYTPAASATELPTPFLQSLQNGIRLVELHNAAVKLSKRRFGLITTFHTDTEKPYRCADNIRYWAKAAELRWEVLLKVDALGIVYNNSPEVWTNLETAVMAWCRKVREEITSELEG